MIQGFTHFCWFSMCFRLLLFVLRLHFNAFCLQFGSEVYHFSSHRKTITKSPHRFLKVAVVVEDLGLDSSVHHQNFLMPTLLPSRLSFRPSSSNCTPVPATCRLTPSLLPLNPVLTANKRGKAEKPLFVNVHSRPSPGANTTGPTVVSLNVACAVRPMLQF